MSVAMIAALCPPASGGDLFEAIDKHALAATADVERQIPSLVQYLTKPAKTETEKLRAISRWIASRIGYDGQLLETGLRAGGRATPELLQALKSENVLKTRKTICQGYCNLLSSLSKQAGIEVVTISGQSRITNISHSWNAVKLSGKWYLLDATGMAGESADPKVGRVFNNFYFLTPPQQLIFFNLPDDPKWQLIPNPVSRAEFLKTPPVDFLLFQAGFIAKDVREKLNDKSFRGFASVGYLGRKEILLENTPIERHLQAGRAYRFRIKTEDYSEITGFNEGAGHAFQRTAGLFEAEINVKKGVLKFGGKEKGDDSGSYTQLLEYIVE